MCLWTEDSETIEIAIARQPHLQLLIPPRRKPRARSSLRSGKFKANAMREGRVR